MAAVFYMLDRWKFFTTTAICAAAVVFAVSYASAQMSARAARATLTPNQREILLADEQRIRTNAQPENAVLFKLNAASDNSKDAIPVVVGERSFNGVLDAGVRAEGSIIVDAYFRSVDEAVGIILPLFVSAGGAFARFAVVEAFPLFAALPQPVELVVVYAPSPTAALTPIAKSGFFGFFSKISNAIVDTAGNAWNALTGGGEQLPPEEPTGATNKPIPAEEASSGGITAPPDDLSAPAEAVAGESFALNMTLEGIRRLRAAAESSDALSYEPRQYSIPGRGDLTVYSDQLGSEACLRFDLSAFEVSLALNYDASELSDGAGAFLPRRDANTLCFDVSKLNVQQASLTAVFMPMEAANDFAE